MTRAQHTRKPSAGVRRSFVNGMSLIELMVAIALGLLILTALALVFANTSTARNEVERAGRQIENGRYATEVLSDDLRMAGYYGGLDPSTAVSGGGNITVPATLDPAVTPAADPCSTNVADWVSALHLYLQGYDASNGSLTCLPTSYKAGTDVLVVRRVSTCTPGVSGCPNATGPYLQVSRCGTETPTTSYVMAQGDPASTATYDRHLKDCATFAAASQYFVNIYFISTNNSTGTITCPGDSRCVPTLKRMEFTGTGWTEVPLVEGIEEMNIEYGVDNDGDGLPDTYTGAPATVADWMNVVTARFYLLARNVDASPRYTDSKTYNLGATAVGPFNDGYRRHVYNSLVRLVNPAGKRDTP